MQLPDRTHCGPPGENEMGNNSDRTYGRGPEPMEQRHTGHCLTASAFRIHRYRNTADIVHGHRLRRKEDRGVEGGYHPQVIGGVRMVRKTVGVLGVRMRVGYGMPLIIMRMDKQRVAHVEPYEQGYEKAVQKAVFSQPFYHKHFRNARIYEKISARSTAPARKLQICRKPAESRFFFKIQLISDRNCLHLHKTKY